MSLMQRRVQLHSARFEASDHGPGEEGRTRRPGPVYATRRDRGDSGLGESIGSFAEMLPLTPPLHTALLPQEAAGAAHFNATGTPPPVPTAWSDGRAWVARTRAIQPLTVSSNDPLIQPQRTFACQKGPVISCSSAKPSCPADLWRVWCRGGKGVSSVQSADANGGTETL